MTPQPHHLTTLQTNVADLFFALPQADGFLLAGGAGLLAHGLINRPTRDLDLFAQQPRSVTAALESLESAAKARRWAVTRRQVSQSFARIEIHHPSHDHQDRHRQQPRHQERRHAMRAAFTEPGSADPVIRWYGNPPKSASGSLWQSPVQRLHNCGSLR